MSLSQLSLKLKAYFTSSPSSVSSVPPPSPSKIHENKKETSIQIILDRKMLLPLSRKIQAMTHPLSCFFAAEVPLFNLGAYWVVKPLKCVFYFLKGWGPVGFLSGIFSPDRDDF